MLVEATVAVQQADTLLGPGTRVAGQLLTVGEGLGDAGQSQGVCIWWREERQGTHINASAIRLKRRGAAGGGNPLLQRVEAAVLTTHPAASAVQALSTAQQTREPHAGAARAQLTLLAGSQVALAGGLGHHAHRRALCAGSGLGSHKGADGDLGGQSGSHFVVDVGGCVVGCGGEGWWREVWARGWMTDARSDARVLIKAARAPHVGMGADLATYLNFPPS